jgi:hydroxypyruvate reductase
MQAIEPRDFLTRVYRSGVAAADPRLASRQAVEVLDDLAPSTWVVAIGKAAHAMASGAVDVLRARRVGIAGGLVVAHAPSQDATHGLPYVQGNHPTPGSGSQLAADYLSNLASETGESSDAIVLVSGGATSLMAAPVDGLSAEDLRAAFASLLASGVDIEIMNAVRKRLLRFGGGRLATALQSRRVHCLVASDVISNDPASIASGPCVPDPMTAGEVRAVASAAGAWEKLPATVKAHIDAMVDGRVPDLPPADHPRFASTTTKVILDRLSAEGGAAAEAYLKGVPVEVVPTPLSGDAAKSGKEFALELVSRSPGELKCVIRTGETTVSLGASPEPGGRCQEFALACAGTLESAGPLASGITVLAAGTDGRDGPTDAAGAIVDAFTWSAIRHGGIDPVAALRHHSSYHALEAAGALLKTGATGTNVNDLVIALLLPS